MTSLNNSLVFTFHNVSIKTRSDVSTNCSWVIFTFHNVSIKTQNNYVGYREQSYLHSTMFLLKLPSLASYTHRISSFTFHNVSIKTRSADAAKKVEKLFTFHNVSIKTMFLGANIDAESVFTFHNVSIKTIP